MSRQKKYKGSESLEKLLPKFTSEQGWRHKLAQCAIFEHWETVMGKDVASRAIPLKISNDVMWLEVENSAWIQQFQYQKIQLLQRVNEFLQNSVIEDMRFVVKDPRQGAKVKEPKVRFEAPPTKEIEAFEDMAATIRDEKSRDALMHFWYLCHACKRE